MAELRSPAILRDPVAVAWPGPAVATSTLAATATCIATRAEAGRNTTTAAGTTSTHLRLIPNGLVRPGRRARPALTARAPPRIGHPRPRTAPRWANSTATRRREATALSEQGIWAAFAAARPLAPAVIGPAVAAAAAARVQRRLVRAADRPGDGRDCRTSGANEG